MSAVDPRRRVELRLSSWRIIEQMITFAEEKGYEIPSFAWEDVRTLFTQLHPKSSDVPGETKE